MRNGLIHLSRVDVCPIFTSVVDNGEKDTYLSSNRDTAGNREMEMLKFHIEEMPVMYEGMGARYVVVAHCGSWRDGEATNSPNLIPELKRELRKRFMNRYATGLAVTAAAQHKACPLTPGCSVP